MELDKAMDIILSKGYTIEKVQNCYKILIGDKLHFLTNAELISLAIHIKELYKS